MKKTIILSLISLFTLSSCAQCQYDDVIENNRGQKNILVNDVTETNYYHNKVNRENHYYLNSTPSRVRYGNVRRPCYVPQSRPQYNERYNSRPTYYGSYEPSYRPNNDVRYNNGKWFFFFDFNSANIHDVDSNELGHLKDYAMANRHVAFRIDSYADIDTGSFDYNDNLARHRADAILRFMIKEGVSAGRIIVYNHGSYEQEYRTNYLNRCVTVKAIPINECGYFE